MFCPAKCLWRYNKWFWLRCHRAVDLLLKAYFLTGARKVLFSVTFRIQQPIITDKSGILTKSWKALPMPLLISATIFMNIKPTMQYEHSEGDTQQLDWRVDPLTANRQLVHVFHCLTTETRRAVHGDELTVSVCIQEGHKQTKEETWEKKRYREIKGIEQNTWLCADILQPLSR